MQKSRSTPIFRERRKKEEKKTARAAEFSFPPEAAPAKKKEKENRREKSHHMTTPSPLLHGERRRKKSHDLFLLFGHSLSQEKKAERQTGRRTGLRLFLPKEEGKKKQTKARFRRNHWPTEKKKGGGPEISRTGSSSSTAGRKDRCGHFDSIL